MVRSKATAFDDGRAWARKIYAEKLATGDLPRLGHGYSDELRAARGVQDIALRKLYIIDGRSGRRVEVSLPARQRTFWQGVLAEAGDIAVKHNSPPDGNPEGFDASDFFEDIEPAELSAVDEQRHALSAELGEDPELLDPTPLLRPAGLALLPDPMIYRYARARVWAAGVPAGTAATARKLRSALKSPRTGLSASDHDLRSYGVVLFTDAGPVRLPAPGATKPRKNPISDLLAWNPSRMPNVFAPKGPLRPRPQYVSGTPFSSPQVWTYRGYGIELREHSDAPSWYAEVHTPRGNSWTTTGSPDAPAALQHAVFSIDASIVAGQRDDISAPTDTVIRAVIRVHERGERLDRASVARELQLMGSKGPVLKSEVAGVNRLPLQERLELIDEILALAATHGGQVPVVH